ncbi:SMODS domain-containing nucleotidyltransferase [Mycoplasmopsis canis]|uniref:SMODS domain-containing nucleotidyltransferase n=1 Tax=Mycoplasmopsis canis TaxID=29555 RepID=UPI00025AF9F3|nr:nucleotidyltransferase domain-containing protein [Mycoplasmopsis canis]EIE40300.1 hypothetical protein MCANUF33_02291 [Mycoplasmopsis canis UF33]
MNGIFKIFHDNIYMNKDVREKIQLRREEITKIIDNEYYEFELNSAISFFSGSYGRNTEIKSSDIDLIVILPNSVKKRFDKRIGNIQSQFLTEVKEKIVKKFPRSEISSDGQVIVIDFSDSIKFEVVPCFKDEFGDFLYYANTNDGGKWETMVPKKEIDAFNKGHENSNFIIKKFCRMIRSWKESNNVPIKGELIDAMVFDFFENYKGLKSEPFNCFDEYTKDFFEYIYKNIDYKSWFVPGSYRILKVENKEFLKRKIYQAFIYAEKAISLPVILTKSYYYSREYFWREIYGERFWKVK